MHHHLFLAVTSLPNDPLVAYALPYISRAAALGGEGAPAAARAQDDGAGRGAARGRRPGTKDAAAARRRVGCLRV